MLEFSVSNQLLSRLDGEQVVSGSRNYLECQFQFSEDWTGLKKVAVFGHGQVEKAIGVELEEDKCRVPHEVIEPYGFQVTLYGSGGDAEKGYTHVPTNVVTVEVAKSGEEEELEVTPTQELYDSVMAKLGQVEETVNRAKVSSAADAQRAEEAAEGAGTAAQQAQTARRQAEEHALAAVSCAQSIKGVVEPLLDAAETAEGIARRAKSYTEGLSEEKEYLMQNQALKFNKGDITDYCFPLEPDTRYIASINNGRTRGSAWSKLEEASGIYAQVAGATIEWPGFGEETPETPEGWENGDGDIKVDIPEVDQPLEGEDGDGDETTEVETGKLVVKLTVLGVTFTYTKRATQTPDSEGNAGEETVSETLVLSGRKTLTRNTFCLFTDGEDNAMEYCLAAESYKKAALTYSTSAESYAAKAQAVAEQAQAAAESWSAHTEDESVHVTQEEKEKWNGLEEALKAYCDAAVKKALSGET